MLHEVPWDNEENLYFIAETFSAFLASLFEYEEGELVPDRFCLFKFLLFAFSAPLKPLPLHSSNNPLWKQQHYDNEGDTQNQ
jgi:hypothetical protein